MLNIFNKKSSATINKMQKYTLQKTKDVGCGDLIPIEALTENEKYMLSEVAQHDVGAAIFYSAILGFCSGVKRKK